MGRFGVAVSQSISNGRVMRSAWMRAVENIRMQIVDGKYLGARYVEMHKGRIGGAINPRAIVVHSTDMAPSTFDALIKSWTTQPGKGNGAHFLIGRDERQGVVQFCSIARNANHAGGPSAGAFVDGQKRYHPNRYSVGIEVHNAGLLRQIEGQWRQAERVDGKLVAVGPAYSSSEVEVPSPIRAPKIGYHLPTAWQITELRKLIAALDATLAPAPENLIAGQSVGKVQPWAYCADARVVFHASLDPTRKGDPWPVIARMVRGAEK